MEKHNGRKIVARNLDFEADALWQELLRSEGRFGDGVSELGRCFRVFFL